MSLVWKRALSLQKKLNLDVTTNMMFTGRSLTRAHIYPRLTIFLEQFLGDYEVKDRSNLRICILK